MSAKRPSKVVEIKCQRHKLPMEVILFHMVDFRAIKGLPLNQDCTDILRTAGQRALDRMFIDGEAFAETFMPRRKEFEVKLTEEIARFRNGKWLSPKKTMISLQKTENSVVIF